MERGGPPLLPAAEERDDHQEGDEQGRAEPALEPSPPSPALRDLDMVGVGSRCLPLQCEPEAQGLPALRIVQVRRHVMIPSHDRQIIRREASMGHDAALPSRRALGFVTVGLRTTWIKGKDRPTAAAPGRDPSSAPGVATVAV